VARTAVAAGRWGARRRPAVLHDPRFVDLAPAEVYATLLDAGQYLCSERTMYRVLAANREVRERRNQLRHPHYAALELLPGSGTSSALELGHHQTPGAVEVDLFLPDVMLDVFSRYVVGWMVAHRESAVLAEQFIRETCTRQGIGREQLTVHADRGPAMTSKPVALLLADLGVTKTHSRPHVSKDNPFSEAQFKTLKYRPAFPARFGSTQDAHAHCHVFFPWYNTEHHHSSLGLLTPFDVHHGLAEQLVTARGGAYCSLCRAPGTIPCRPAPSPSAARGSVDQPPNIPAPSPEPSDTHSSPLAHPGPFV
jgi:putative transposase